MADKNLSYDLFIEISNGQLIVNYYDGFVHFYET